MRVTGYRPARHHLGDVLRVDLLPIIETAGRSEAVLPPESGDLLLGLPESCRSGFRAPAVIALPFGLLASTFSDSDLILVGLNLF